MNAPRPCSRRRPCAQPCARAPPLLVMFIRFVLPFSHWRSGRRRTADPHWTFVHLTERHGVPVSIYRTRRPGIVVYSDDYQIAAVPWRDTFAERAHSHA